MIFDNIISVNSETISAENERPFRVYVTIPGLKLSSGKIDISIIGVIVKVCKCH